MPTADDPILRTDPTLKAITAQIEKSPTNAVLYFERGKKLQKMQLDSLALFDYKAAISLDSTKAEYYSAVGGLLFDRKDVAGSVEWIQKAIALDPKDRKARLKIAKLFLFTQDYTQSLEQINMVLRQNVYEPEAYFLKGMVYKELKDTAKAISSFQTSVQVSPDYRPATEQLGLLYSAKQDPIALKYLDNAYKLDSSDVFPIFAQGVYYQQANDLVQAKAAYRRCILRDRHYVNAYMNMGYLLMQEDSTEKAYRQYDIASKVDPFNAAAYYNRGICNELMDSVTKAVADYRQALYLDSTYDKPKAALKRLKALKS